MLGSYREDQVSSSRLPASGMSLMELLVVLAVLLILTSGIASGYTNMQRAQKINRASEALLSTLNLTRNLAISNNAVAYLEIVGTDPTAKLSMGASQVMKIHIFPSPADALTVSGEPAPNGSTPNSFSNTPANLVQLAPNAWNPTKNFPWVEPGSIAYQDGTSTPIPGTGQSYTNYQTDVLPVEPATLAGISPMVLPIDTTGTSPILIGFNPDGTCCTPDSKLYVTDDPKRLYNNDVAVTTAVQGHDPHLKLIHVYVGGLIKQE